MFCECDGIFFDELMIVELICEATGMFCDVVSEDDGS